MKPDRWRQIDELFHAVAERPPHEHEAFLDEACAGNDSLRHEVESLLAADSAAEEMATAKLPAHVAAEMLDKPSPRVAAGQLLNQYRILSALGAGGMGEVFLAEDSRLKRKVALKLLPAHFASDPDRVRRFEQEAQAVSALNHPNILTIYEVGESERHHFLVTEFIEGQTLRQQLNDGRLPVRAVLNVATQVVSALAAAHAAGIIHRDIKPENIIVRPDGVVKVLDFGLAKLTESGITTSEPAEKKASTESGVVMGTIGYMSPEQVRGQKVDHRSDIFALGVILYEMLAGHRAFTGDSAVEVMNAILKEEPPELAETNAKISPALDRIVRRCLEKKNDQRFQSASDLGFALEALSSPGSAGFHPASTSRMPALPGGWRERIAWIAAGVLGLAALALAVAYFNRSAADVQAVRLAFVPPENLVFNNGLFDYVVVSPDGRKLAFTGRSADGKKQLWVSSLDTMDAQPLPGTDEPTHPFWSPDSRSLGFASKGKLMRIDLPGASPKVLCDVGNFLGGTWSKNGVILFAPRSISGLLQIPADGGEPKPVTTLNQEKKEYIHEFPCFLPDGNHFLYRVEGSDGSAGVFVASLDSKEVKRILTDETSAIYAPPGWLLFVSNGALTAQSFDIQRLELKGDPYLITRPTTVGTVLHLPFSVSENGMLVWQGDRWQDYQLIWFDRDGKLGDTIGPPIKVIATGQNPRFSPDGKRAVIQRSDPQTSNNDLWEIDLLHNLPTRLTTDPAFDLRPIWSPDGNRVVFGTIRGSVAGLFQKNLSGAGTEELLLKDGGGAPIDWSPNGRFIIYTLIMDKTRVDLCALPLFGDRQPSPLLNSEFDDCQAQFSPDGRWLAYVSDDSGNYEVYVQSFTAEGKLGGNKIRISTSGGMYPRFRDDGQEMFYVAADGQMMAVAVKPSLTVFEHSAPKALFKTRMVRGQYHLGIDYDVTADGRRFLIGTLVGEPAPVSVILNWTVGLKH